MVRTVSSISAKSDSTSSDSTSTRYSATRYPPSVLSAGWDADDEDCVSMSNDDHAPPSPIALAIPKANSVHGPYCPRRPNLREILANTSEAPWTLTAFMAYLSNNHCLETLEFTMDAARYKKHYAKMMSRAGANGLPPIKDREYVQALWERLVEAYIEQNGTREVNIPSNVRDPILDLRPAELPPSPDKLDPAVAKIYELMEESVLVPFLNSVYPQGSHPSISSCPPNTSEEVIAISNSRDDHPYSHYGRRGRHARNSPPPQTVVEPYAHSYTAPSMMNRKSAPSTFNTMHHVPIRHKLAQTTSSPATARSYRSKVEAVSSAADVSGYDRPGMTDDSGSTDSPSNESPTTPPATPPKSDMQDPPIKRDSGMWKKLGRGLSMNPKKKSQAGLKEER